MVGRRTLKVVVQTDEGVRRPSSSRWESIYSGSLSQSRTACTSEGLGEQRGRVIEGPVSRWSLCSEGLCGVAGDCVDGWWSRRAAQAVATAGAGPSITRRADVAAEAAWGCVGWMAAVGMARLGWWTSRWRWRGYGAARVGCAGRESAPAVPPTAAAASCNKPYFVSIKHRETQLRWSFIMFSVVIINL